MRRSIFGVVFLLVVSGLALGAPLTASASSAGTQKHASTVQCAKVATSHKKVTKAGVTLVPRRL